MRYHGRAGGVGFERVPEHAGVVQTHLQLLSKESRAGEPDGHPAQTSRVAIRYQGGDPLGTERHGAEPVEEHAIEAAAASGLHVEVVG
jgi:hypothetical protein